MALDICPNAHGAGTLDIALITIGLAYERLSDQNETHGRSLALSFCLRHRWQALGTFLATGIMVLELRY